MLSSTTFICSRQLQFVSEAQIQQSSTENESLVEFCYHFFKLPNRARNFKHLRSIAKLFDESLWHHLL